ADEFQFIKLTAEGKLERFFAEALNRILEVMTSHAPSAPTAPVKEALRLNQALLSQPRQYDDLMLGLDCDVWRFYRGVLSGERVVLSQGAVQYRVERSRENYDDLQTWCREVVWYGHRRGAYYHSNRPVTVELAGHY